ncbi:hypothetical protein CDAR_577651 [Caerostris darwini]|uniref:Uncharacterized protein n=1 Tax=Caerostris darwini TaxID=1538125 RepID=A0AAV4URT2_9ARAC|nr:hypothetical protein CDAR_577651 [Caerostris darwini]
MKEEALEQHLRGNASTESFPHPQHSVPTSFDTNPNTPVIKRNRRKNYSEFLLPRKEWEIIIELLKTALGGTNTGHKLNLITGTDYLCGVSGSCIAPVITFHL